MKRFLSILLASTMMAGMLSVQAFAFESGISVQEVIPIETPQTPDTTNSTLDNGTGGDLENTDSNAIQDGESWGSDYDTATEFTISTEAELCAFAKMVNNGNDFSGKTVKLEEPITLTVEQWTPIAGKSGTAFAGTFDGQGNTISGLTLTLEAPTQEITFPGLFGTVSGTIQNVVLENVNISSPQPNGGIASVLRGGTIESCSVSGTVQVTANKNGSYVGMAGGIVAMVQGSGTIQDCQNEANLYSKGGTVGGIAGQVAETTITGCTNYGNIEGRNCLGGIVGKLDGTISSCVNNGTVTSNAEAEINESLKEDVGGIAGNATVEAEVFDCTNNGTVTAKNCNRVGGIVGYIYAGSDVTNCENTASVTGKKGVGGVVGYAAPDGHASANKDYGYSIVGCANSGPVSGEENVGGVVGITCAVADENESMAGLALEVSSCNNKGSVSGTTNVGGIVGSNNAVSTSETKAIQAATEVSGCINTGRVPDGAGAIVGKNNDQGTTSSEKKAGIVQNNFWPEELNANAVGNGAGASDSGATEAVKNNSSYQPDGTLTTAVQASDGNEIKNLGDAINKLIGNGGSNPENIPDAMKVTVTYDCGGHGTAPNTEKVTMGTSVTLPSMENDGYYTFTDWSDGSTIYEAGATVTVMEDTTFTAQWRNDTPPSTSGGGGSSSPTRYTVSVDQPDNGSIRVSPSRAERGDTVTITVTPDDGYELDTLTVTDADGDRIDVGRVDDTHFTFEMPRGRVTVEATFVRITEEPEPLPFLDVPVGAYYYDAVAWAVENGVTSGTSATTFSPDNACTRAQMVTFLWRAAGEPEPETTVNPFTDISAGTYYYEAVLWAVEQGITNGTSATTFSPDATVTRGQTVTFLWRNAGSPAASGASFADVSADAYYGTAVAWAASEGITSGTSATTFSPDNACTRAQIVTFLYRAQQG